MGQKTQRDLTARDFKPDSFQHAVLSLRELAVTGDAAPEQAADWQALAAWLGCGNGPVTDTHADRLKTACIAFLHAADGSMFDAAQLPPPEIQAVFERLSPSAPAIARLKARHETPQKPKPAGISRQSGALVGGFIAFGVILAIYMSKGTPSDPAPISELAGEAAFPATVAFATGALWKGGPSFRPFYDGSIVAAVAAILFALSSTGQVSVESGQPVAPLVVLIAAVVLFVPVWVLTVAVTWGSSRLTKRLKGIGAVPSKPETAGSSPMTEDQQKLCRGLITFPNASPRVSKPDFLRRFPSAVAHGKLAPGWLEGAYERRSAGDLSCALRVGFVFGFAPEHRETFQRLIDEDWHTSHEDVVSALVNLPTVDNVEALFRATQWVPAYLEFDDNRALAVKAIWGLGAIPDAKAKAKLEILAYSENDILRTNAIKQLERRGHGGQ